MMGVTMEQRSIKKVDKSPTPSQPQVTFYTKAGCHLCDDARNMLDDIAALISYDLTEIDIRRDDALFEQYRYRIPVILIDGTIVAEGRIEYRYLAQVFHV
jgi:glutaredoxin